MAGITALPGSVDTAIHSVVPVVEQVQLARDTYRVRLECPGIAEQIVPGQFIMVRAPGLSDPLLGRPFALYDVFDDEQGRPQGVDFGYLVVGKLTRMMTGWRPGDPVEVWGPLGNGFPVSTSGHWMFVAGGIGQTPFLAVAREALGLHTYGKPTRVVADRPERVTLCYGTRSAEYLAGLDDFEMPGLDVRVATDDGSQGHHGFVTDLLAESIDSETPPDGVYCCGPEPMMRTVHELVLEHKIPCWLSLESPMACGFGVCFSCVAKVRTKEGGWDYRRACVEGPVFPAESLIL